MGSFGTYSHATIVVRDAGGVRSQLYLPLGEDVPTTKVVKTYGNLFTLKQICIIRKGPFLIEIQLVFIVLYFQVMISLVAF